MKFILIPLCSFIVFLVLGCGSSGTEIVNVTHVFSDEVDFAGVVTFPSGLNVSAKLQNSSSSPFLGPLKGVLKISDFQVIATPSGKTSAIASDGKYLLTGVRRNSPYFFQVRDSKGNTLLTAATAINGVLNINLDSTVNELIFAEARSLKSSLTFNEYSLIASNSESLKTALLNFLTEAKMASDTRTSSGTYSVKSDPDLASISLSLGKIIAGI